MFQSLEYTRFLGYNKKTKLYSYEYELTDSDFSCVVVVVAPAGTGMATHAVIQEYTKRNLNVAKNLLLYFRWYEKEDIYSIAKQIEWAERNQPLFTPQLKADLNKYLSLL
jgi:hypothetical protein